MYVNATILIYVILKAKIIFNKLVVELDTSTSEAAFFLLPQIHPYGSFDLDTFEVL